jgi:hypothetical protein
MKGDYDCHNIEIEIVSLRERHSLKMDKEAAPPLSSI